MTRPSLAARALMALVRAYQIVLSPLLGGHCRFEPSCSRYAASCLEIHGAWRGSLLSMLRLCKCHPFHAGGFDPPPAAPPHSSPHAPRSLLAFRSSRSPSALTLPEVADIAPPSVDDLSHGANASQR
jgi:putative membrane protein insertion efficiency factor